MRSASEKPDTCRAEGVRVEVGSGVISASRADVNWNGVVEAAGIGGVRRMTPDTFDDVTTCGSWH